MSHCFGSHFAPSPHSSCLSVADWIMAANSSLLSPDSSTHLAPASHFSAPLTRVGGTPSSVPLCHVTCFGHRSVSCSKQGPLVLPHRSGWLLRLLRSSQRSAWSRQLPHYSQPQNEDTGNKPEPNLQPGEKASQSLATPSEIHKWEK